MPLARDDKGQSDKGQGKTPFKTQYGEICASTLARKAKEKKQIRYSRKLRYYYIVADARLDGIPVRIFLIKRSEDGQWNGLLTTDIWLDFFRAWDFYEPVEIAEKKTKAEAKTKTKKAA